MWPYLADVDCFRASSVTYLNDTGTFPLVPVNENTDTRGMKGRRSRKNQVCLQ